MNISLYTLTSPLHDENAVNAASAEFLEDIESRLRCTMNFRGPDFSAYGTEGLDVRQNRRYRRTLQGGLP